MTLRRLTLSSLEVHFLPFLLLYITILIQSLPIGGTAGCIIAGRLAEDNPSLSILVIEGGANNKDAASVVNPVFYLQNLLPATKTALFYKGNKSKQLADREPIVPCGGTLGGGSSINFMMYTRAQRSDFDSWNTPGWSAQEMWPYLKRHIFHLRKLSVNVYALRDTLPDSEKI